MRVACLLFLSAWWIPAGAGADGGPSLTVRAPHKWLFGLGSTVQLSAQVLDGAGSPVEGASIDWSSSDTAIATVDATGSVMATGFGTVTIRAVWGEAAGEQRLRVTPDVPWEIEPGRDIVFRNVTVVPMDEERVLSNQTVVVRDGRIVSMGPAESIDAPEQAESIDAEGLYLMPGLADMHSHFLHGNPHWQNDLFLYLANGVTAVREMWGSTEFLRWRDLASSSGVPAPTLYISSPGMDGPESRFAPGTPPVTTAEQARWTVATYKWQGFDFIKVYTDLRPEVYQAILEEAARQGLRVVGHAPSRVPFETVVASGQASIEHLSRVWQEVVSGSFYTGIADESKLESLLPKMAESGVWMVPTLYVQARNTERVTAMRQRAEMRYVSPEMKRWFDDPTNVTTSRDVAPLESNLGLLLKRLHSEGVRLMLGTDCGYGSVIPGFAIHDELRMTVEAGLTPYEALRLATVNPAAFLGSLDRGGTVEPGKRADLLLLEENPLDDIRNADKRVGVLAGGRWLSEKRLRWGLENIAREYGN